MSEDRDNDRHTHDFEREFRQALDEVSLIADPEMLEFAMKAADELNAEVS